MFPTLFDNAFIAATLLTGSEYAVFFYGSHWSNSAIEIKCKNTKGSNTLTCSPSIFVIGY